MAALQEPVLRAVRFGFEWKISPRFPDVRGHITDVLRRAADSEDEWLWDATDEGPVIAAWNDDSRLHLVGGTNRLDVLSEAPDQDVAAAAAASALDRCLEALGLDEVVELTASAIWTLAAADFREAAEGLEEWLLRTGVRQVLEPVGGRPTDMSLSFRFANETDVESLLLVAPVSDEEATSEGFFLSYGRDELPPAALLVRLDRDDSRKCPSAEAVDRARRHLEQLLVHGPRIMATVEARDDHC